MIRREIHLLLVLATEREPGEDAAQYVTEADLALLHEKGITDANGVVSDKGEAYISALEGVPLPVQRWCLPADYGRRFDPIEVSDAVTLQQAGKAHGSSGSQPEGREASGDSAERGTGVQPRRRKQRTTQPSNEQKG